MSTWGDVAAAIAKEAPLLGTLVPGIGTVVGAGVSAAASIVASALGTTPSPDSVMDALKADPDALAKVRQAELDNQSKLADIAAERDKALWAAQVAQRQADTADLGAVNATMQAEAAAKQGGFNGSWRAMNGYVVAFASGLMVLFCGALFAMALITHQTQALAVIPELASAVALILSIPGAAVGITAWHAGRAQTIQAAGTSMSGGASTS